MKEYSSAMKGEENHDLTLQWNIVYVILNILSPWYMLLDDLFLKNKRKKKKGKIEKKKKKIPPLLELALWGVWSWVRQEVLITSVKYVNPPFCSSI